MESVPIPSTSKSKAKSKSKAMAKQRATSSATKTTRAAPVISHPTTHRLKPYAIPSPRKLSENRDTGALTRGGTIFLEPEPTMPATWTDTPAPRPPSPPLAIERFGLSHAAARTPEGKAFIQATHAMRMRERSRALDELPPPGCSWDEVPGPRLSTRSERSAELLTAITAAEERRADTLQAELGAVHAALEAERAKVGEDQRRLDDLARKYNRALDLAKQRARREQEEIERKEAERRREREAAWEAELESVRRETERVRRDAEAAVREAQRRMWESEERARQAQREIAEYQLQERKRREAEEAAAAARRVQRAREHFAEYERKWEFVRKMAPTDTERLEFWAFPWPVLTDCEARENVVNASGITRDAVRAFMLHAERPKELGPNAKTQQQKIRAEMLRFHPDKFNTTVLSKIVKADQGKAKEAASIVARALTELLAAS